MASNSLPSCSICSSLSLERGLSIIVAMGFLAGPFQQGLERDLYGSFGSVDAGPHHLPLRAGDLARPQVPDLAGAELADAGVADAHAASERQRRARLLTGDEDRLGAIALALDIAVEELHRAALALLRVALADDRLEALHVQVVAVRLALPAVAHGVEHLRRPADERLAVAPVRAQLVEVVRAHAAHLVRVLLVQAKAVVLLRHAPQLLAEDHVVGGARRVQQDDVVERLAARQRAQHAHDRRDAAAGADEEEALGERVGQDERALDAAEAHDPAASGLAHEVGGDLALLHELRRDADAPVRAPRI